MREVWEGAFAVDLDFLSCTPYITGKSCTKHSALYLKLAHSNLDNELFFDYQWYI